MKLTSTEPFMVRFAWTNMPSSPGESATPKTADSVGEVWVRQGKFLRGWRLTLFQQLPPSFAVRLAILRKVQMKNLKTGGLTGERRELAPRPKAQKLEPLNLA